MATIEFEDSGLDQRTINVLESQHLVAGAPADEWWERQASATQEKFMDTVRTSMTNGESISQAATRIVGGTVDGVRVDGFMEVSKAQANALAATSMNAVTNQARLDTFREMDDVVKAVQQISTLDNRTTDICIAYSGGVWDIETLEPLNEDTPPFNGGPPRHFGCRSTLAPVTMSFKELGLKGSDLPAGTRASMDGQVPGDITFDAWLDGKGEPFQDRLLGRERAALWRDGKITLRDLLDFRGNPMTLDQLDVLVAARAGTKSATLAGISAEGGISQKEAEALIANWGVGSTVRIGDDRYKIIAIRQARDVKPLGAQFARARGDVYMLRQVGTGDEYWFDAFSGLHRV